VPRKPSSVAPGGPKACQRHVAGLLALVLVRVSSVAGLKTTSTLPVAGLKFAVMGAYWTLMWRKAVPVDVPSLTCS
jgi:hypothetical protein